MSRDNLAADLLPQRVDIGLSALIGITALPGQIALSIEYLSGGTLEIASFGASIGWGQGFIVPANAILTFDVMGTVWLTSSGATTTIQVIRGRSQGFEGASMGYLGT